MCRHGVPEKMPIAGSDAQEAAIKRDHEEHGTALELRQSTSLHNLVAQDPRAVKRITRPLLGCKSCAAAQDPLVGIARRHMITKRPMGGGEGLTVAEQLYALAA